MFAAACFSTITEISLIRPRYLLSLAITASQTRAMGHVRAPSPEVSRRIRSTDDPVMVQAQRMLGDVQGVASLAQGAVWYGPPEGAITDAVAHAHEPAYSRYGPDEGLPELRAALQKKIEAENGLRGYSIMVTAGANQALSSLMLTLLDPTDTACLYKPYYFNALMALQMTGCGQNLAYGPCHPDTWHPDLDWLQDQFEGHKPPKLVYIVNPCNPTGVTLSKPELERLAELTRQHGAWLVIDDTYESFLFSGEPHHCPQGPHIIHVFSFSKAWGLMGWRCGYIAYPNQDGSDYLGLQLVKVQDTIPIHAAHMSQKVAVGALAAGKPWLDAQIQALRSNRQALMDALSPLGKLNEAFFGGDAIYVWARLPPGCQDDKAVVKWMVYNHKVSVIPGSGCGCAGYIRCAFGKPEPSEFKKAATRLKAALTELSEQGFAVVERWQESLR